MSLLTSSLNIHLNIGQDLIMNTSEVFMSLETNTINSLSNKQIKQIGNGQISLPTNFNSNINKNSTVSIRVCFLIFFSNFSFLIYFVVKNGTTCFIWKFKIFIKYKSFNINITFNS